MDMEQLAERYLAEGTEVVGQNLAHYLFVHHKSYMNGSWIERGPSQWEAGN